MRTIKEKFITSCEKLGDEIAAYHDKDKKIAKLNADIKKLIQHIRLSDNNRVVLAKKVITVLETKGLAGCDNGWIGTQNGNGEEIGSSMDQLIKTAKKICHEDN